VRDFLLAPDVLGKGRVHYKNWFVVPKKDYEKTAKDEPQEVSGRATKRLFDEDSLTYRLRIVALKKGQESISPEEWVVTDTKWPSTVTITLNGEQCEPRRKMLHGKDCPFDLTPRIRECKPDDPIELTVGMTKGGKNQDADVTYAVAVEVVQMFKHETITKMVTEKHVRPKSETLNGIRRVLSGTSHDDDDLAMVSDDLVINLADPFSSVVFETPVKGKNCRHWDCFDLEMWLQSRGRKQVRGAEQPSLVDAWKCPLCDGDARPQSLVVDEFLAEVREKLKGSGDLERDIKSISVDKDGEWLPKEEPEPVNHRTPNPGRAQSRVSNASAEGRESATPAPVLPKEKVIEVIDLDD
jgi:hypothetical protein